MSEVPLYARGWLAWGRVLMGSLLSEPGTNKPVEARFRPWRELFSLQKF